MTAVVMLHMLCALCLQTTHLQRGRLDAGAPSVCQGSGGVCRRSEEPRCPQRCPRCCIVAWLSLERRIPV